MKTTTALLASLVLLTGCTIDRRTIVTETTTKETSAPNTTSAPRQQAYNAESRFIEAIDAVIENPIYVSDRELIDTGWSVCEGVSNGATAQDMIDIANEAAPDADTYELLIAVSIAAVMFLCPEYEYILYELEAV